MASNVPKFASFRPKPSPAPEPPRASPKHEVKAKSISKGKPARDIVEPRTPESSKIERDTSSSKLYFSDRRGDLDVLKYGTLNRCDIPAYRRAGYGYVLGLSLDQKIDRERSSQSKVYLATTTRQRQERLLTGKHVPKEGSRTLRIVQSSDKQTIEEGHDFIAVSTPHQRRRDDSDDDEGEDKQDLGYRSIERDRSQPLDPDTRYDDEIGDITVASELTKKSSELVRKTRECPGELQVWLAFTEHQEAMMSLDLTTLELSAAARRQIADLRIPIYEEALKKVRNESDAHVRLYKELFSEAQRLWTDAKLSTKWTEVLALHPTSTDLWLMYLDLVQSNFAPFKYESCRATFLKCLEVLQASKTVAVESILHIFIRMTAFIHGAGYQELALAIWQAVLERCLARPAMTEADAEDFEQFWESEAPRIGEVGASGWRKCATNDLPAAMVQLQVQDPSDSVFEDFRKREADSIEKLRYPGRTTEDVGEDDAFHTIFFADIEPYLKFIPTETPIVLVLEAFLCFCGLPELPRIASHQRAWWSDPFLNCTSTQTSSTQHQGKTSNPFLHKLGRLSACERKSVQMTSDLLFEHSFSLSGIRLNADFVRRTLKFAATDSSDEVLGEYLLAFEHRHFPADVVKTAKQLLKAQPTSQRLYHAYGLVESRRGKSDKANQVFSMALSMGTSGTYESLLLLHSWVWQALQCDGPVEALWRLTSPSGKLPSRLDFMLRPDPSALDTASIDLSETCENALLRHDYCSAVISTSLLALLAYLRSDGNPELALSAHQSLSRWFTSHKLSTSPYSELNAQALARFLAYHTTHAPIVKPALIRSTLELLISLFPNNTILLALYAANEARFTVDDRVRGIMHQTALQSSHATSVAGWSFAIHFETLRGESSSSTSHSIRALHKRATHPDSSGAHSPLLWSSYLCFEIDQVRIERAKTAGRRPGRDGKKRGWESRLEEAESRVKETFYAGLRALPWCKDFYMLGFAEEMRNVLGEEGMRKVYGVVGEKEVRVYVEID